MGGVAKDRDWFVEKDRIGVPTWKEVRSRISIARLTWPRIDVKVLRLSFPEENNGSLKKIPKLDDPSQYSRLGLVSIPQEIIDTHELQTITFDHRRECQYNDIVDSLVSPEFSDDGSTNGAVDSDPHLNDQDLQEFLHLLRLSGSGLKINGGRTVEEAGSLMFWIMYSSSQQIKNRVKLVELYWQLL
ncbi:oleoyl-acyl carrier protein thioesterase, chloroplastic-like [Zingiber officinale]|uniref:Acyl-ACP thioesterase-like C-terminal domain-containing protein n=1 Tax=Zingiber officinale TaxID=94328 RepID=A0A8J5HE26_ZINOF|nr:oleoyl-acyl carrier protein thioesterase, chloroplastic-like [Zingiber officinale]KAG6526221.1 hypothetical protein ZIOFF_016203 [Zingiber officinale]